MTKIYISGPMTGCEDLNRDNFNECAHRIQAQGHIVLNPAAMFPAGLEYDEYMALCKPAVLIAELVVMLPGWKRSPGARKERQWAESNHIPVSLNHPALEGCYHPDCKGHTARNPYVDGQRR